MSQVSRPTAVSGTGWTGAYTTIADDSDATYIESDPEPVIGEPLTVVMEALVDPGVDTGHTLTVRVAKDDDTNDQIDVVVSLLDGSDDSVIATVTEYAVDDAPHDVTIALSEAQAALMNYGNIKVQVAARSSVFTIYATPEAGTGGTGTYEDPYHDLQDALDAAGAGDAIGLFPGTFTAGGATGWTSAAHGTPNARITIAPINGPLTTSLDGNGTAVNVLEIGHGYWTIDGLEIENAAFYGIKIDGDDNGSEDGRGYGNYANNFDNDPEHRRNYVNGAETPIIRNCYVHDCVGDGIKVNHTNNLLIEDTEVYKTGIGTQQQGIDILGVYGVTIRNCYIHDDPAAASMDIGIFCKGGCEDVLIENCLVEDIVSPSAGISVGQDTESYNTRYTPSAVSAEFHEGMFHGRTTPPYPLDVEENYVGSTMAECRSAVVRGCLLINCDPPIAFQNVSTALAYCNTAVEGGGTQGWVKLWHDGTSFRECANVTLYNNVFQNDVTALGYSGSRYNNRNAGYNLDGFDSDYHCYYNCGEATIIGQNMGTENPDTHSTAADADLNATHHPNVGSPALTGGLDLETAGVVAAGTTWTDRDGAARAGTDTVRGALLGA